VLVWGAVAAVMMLVMLVALQYGSPERNAERPALGADTGLLPRPTLDEPRTTVETMSTQMKADPEASSLRGDLFALREELTALRKTVDGLRQQNDALVLRIDALEKRRFDEFTGSIDRSDFGPLPARAVPPPAAKPTGAKTGEVTGSTPRTAASQAATRQAGETGFGLEIGTFADMTSLRARWRDLQQVHPDLFGALDAVASVRDRGGRTELLLVAGPYGNAATAAQACRDVESEGIGCTPAFFLGQPLDLR